MPNIDEILAQQIAHLNESDHIGNPEDHSQDVD